MLTSARQRDAKPAAIREIATEDGAVRMRVPVKLVAKLKTAEGAHSMRLDVGRPKAASCEPLNPTIDMASLLRVRAELIFQRLGAVQGEVKTKAVDSTHSGVFTGQPCMTIEWVYRVKSDDGPLLGGLEQFVAKKSGVALFCTHVDAGYSKSFRSVTTALVASLELQLQHVEPCFSEVSRMALGNAPTGISVTTLTMGDNGDTPAYDSTALFMSNGGNAPHALNAGVQVLRSDGSLFRAPHSTETNGSLETQFHLAKDDQDYRAVQGNMKGMADVQPVVDDKLNHA